MVQQLCATSLVCSLPSSLLSSACHPHPHALQITLANATQREWNRRRRRCFIPPTRSRPTPFIVMQATEQKQQQGQVKEEEIVDNKILPYCSINKQAEKRTLGELERDFLEALQSFYFENKSIMTNEEFDNLKEELMWEGSSVVMLSPDEQKFMEASLAYAAGKPIMTDAQYDELKLNLKKAGSKVAIEGPRCSLRTRNVYSDLSVDYLKMFLLNVPAAIVALTLVFFLDDLTGFEITYLLELPEPYSFIVTWFLVLPTTYLIAQAITNVILKDFLILKGPCPNCGRENVSFYGTILTVPSGGPVNQVKCEICGTMMMYNSETRLITLAPNKQEGSKVICFKAKGERCHHYHHYQDGIDISQLHNIDLDDEYLGILSGCKITLDPYDITHAHHEKEPAIEQHTSSSPP